MKAADAIRATFNCSVLVVHHCGVAGTRPRGHTALTGAVDAQLSVTRDGTDTVIVEVELAKDGPQGDRIASTLKAVEVGTDVDGEKITSCVVMPVDTAVLHAPGEPKLTKNQQTMLSILHSAAQGGMTTEQWNEKARAVDIGVKRKADLYDLREGLKSKNLVREFNGRWNVSNYGTAP